MTCTALFWGLSFHAGKVALASMAPLGAAAMRFIIASLVLVPIAALREPALFATMRRNAGPYLALGVCGVAGFNGFLFLGLQYTSPVNGAMIMSTNPLLVTCFARLFLGERLRWAQQVGGALCLLGVGIVITRGSLATLTSMRANPGDLLIVGANTCWALYTVFVRRWVHAVPSLVTTTATVLVCTLCLACMSLFETQPMPLEAVPAAAWGALAFLGIAGSAMAYLFWNLGIVHLGAPRTSVFFNFVPLFTTLCSLLLGDSLHASQLVGGALAVGGVLLSTRTAPGRRAAA